MSARRAAHALLLAAVALSACRKEADLPIARRVPLAAPAPAGATLAVDASGRSWLGVPGRLLPLPLSPAERAGPPVAVEGEGVPRVEGSVGRRLLLRVGERLALAEAVDGAVAAARAAPGAFAADPRGRWVYATRPRGGVLGLGPDSLRPAWGWAEAGPATTALAVSPLGDRVYHALAAGAERDAPSRLLVRDQQTGRVLSTVELAEPATALSAGRDGTLYLAWGEGGRTVAAYRPTAEGAERVWATTLRWGSGAEGVELRPSPDGRRVAVLSRGEGGGLRLLDALTGSEVGRTKEAPLDAAWGGGGRLLLLYPGEVRVAR